MRIELDGKGLPIPVEALPNDVAPVDLVPIVFTPASGFIFRKDEYIAQGYTHYEVMCVGAAGGNGGKATYFQGGSLSTWLHTFGGAGGGGGMQIVSGLLEGLPDSCLIVVGEAGAHGANGAESQNQEPFNPGEPGQDGGFSSFGEDICQASGGKGGAMTPVNKLPLAQRWRYGGAGGDGGVGGQITPGGGALGGTSVFVEEEHFSGDGPSEQQDTAVDGEQGTWEDEIGQGGGGGVGGTAMYKYDNIIWGT